VFAVVSADHIVSTASAAAGAHRYLFPPLSASVAASLDPAYRLSLFAVALLLTLRMGRVYERWWAARSAMSGLGSACLQIAVRARLWAGEAAADEVGRWAVAWQFSLWQVLTNAPAPHPALRALLPPPAYAVLAASPKPRQVSVAQIMRLMEPTLRARDSVAAPFYILLDRATAAAGTLTGIQLQALPIAITYTCTGFVELFLATYPLTGLAVKSGRSGGAAAAGGGHMHDDSLTSVIWTLAIQFFLYIIMNLLFLGADEVASMMENPYAEIPLEELAKTTPRDVVRMWAELRALDEVGGGGGGGRGGKAGLAGTDERWRAALKICAKTR
jgi:predicted membrane chloride channel (bestrophin family)